VCAVTETLYTRAMHMRTFEAKDKSGTRYTINGYAGEAKSVAERPGLRRHRFGGLRLRTDTGALVNWKSKGIYEMADTGDVLTSDDPNAF
jgi:hypothetical protein